MTSNKVAAVTLAFWIIKIAATTLGETGGDTVSMSLHLGYAAGTAIFLAVFVVAVIAQIRAESYRPFLYWTTVIATTTVGTTMADYADRSLGIGYTGGSLLLFILLAASLALWRLTLGSVSVSHIRSAKAELFYWVTILFSNTLGTALGDWLADTGGFGYEGGSLVFAGILLLIAGAYYFTKLSHTLLFWLAFIFTRPLGATLGDLLTKPLSDGGLNLSRASASGVIAIFIIGCILVASGKIKNHQRRDEQQASG